MYFWLQTKFRPELQEDTYYSRYLEARISNQTGKPEVIDIRAGSTTTNATDAPLPSLTSGVEGETISLNDLLPEFKQIAEGLRTQNLKIHSTFGYTSSPPDTPAQFIISVGPDVSVETMQKVFKVCMNKGLNGINIMGGKFGRKTIYIGGYGYRLAEYTKISEDLKKSILATTLSKDEFTKIVIPASNL